MQTQSYLYKDKPLFGLDIGHNTVKVMQTKHADGGKSSIVGYGIGSFDPENIKDGVITDHKALAGAMVKIFENNIVGEINTRRVAVSIPAARTFTRTIMLPPIKDDEISDAVQIEAEQYIPVPIEELYLDYVLIDKSENGIELLAVAAPKKIVDSYIQLINVMGLEPVGFDTSILAAARLFQHQDDNNDIPTVLVDFGSMSTDITIYDKTVIVTSTIPNGGDVFNELIAKKLKVSPEEAYIIKTKYGIGKSRKQKEIMSVIKPTINQLAKEIQRMIRYHEERSESKQKIGQIISMGGGANMPGLSEHLTDTIRLPVRTCEPLSSFDLHKLRAPSMLEKSIFVTVAGLSLIRPEELFAQ